VRQPAAPSGVHVLGSNFERTRPWLGRTSALAATTCLRWRSGIIRPGNCHKPSSSIAKFSRPIPAIGALQYLGALALQSNRPALAVEAIGRALALNDRLPEGHHQIAYALCQLHRLDDAVVHYRRAIALSAHDVDAHYNLGNALALQGKSDEARACFERALALKPDFIDAYNNLARVFWAKGLADETLGVLRRALAVQETPETRTLLVQCAASFGLVPDVDDFRNLIARALTEHWCRTADISGVATTLVSRDKTLAPYIDLAVSAWPSRLPARDLLGSSGLIELAQHRLLRCLLECAPVSNFELECFLTAVRCAVLELAADGPSDVSEDVLRLGCALARQCFLNDYVFACTDAELERVRHLQDKLASAIESAETIPELRLAALGAYVPLHSLHIADALAERSWSDAASGLIAQQVREPREERQLRASIPALTPIEDGVSLTVREQYEENPYPRWVNAEPAGNPVSMDQYFIRKFPRHDLRSLGNKDALDILVAGCGTGQHPIETAQRFRDARVLAIDLSLASLSLARRKTRALNLSNIEFAQADILKLPTLGRTFDVIEAGGVLHHLADPFAGWCILLSLLRPGGLMAVGLYSECGRADLAPARAFIAERGYRPTAEDIRRCRQDLLALNHAAMAKRLLSSVDFFSTSGCRDPLFHVQEHRLTLPQIAAFIAENELAFLGFDLDGAVNARYQARFAADRTMTDFSCWHVFETENPTTFNSMYKFWVRKKPG
jgi:SAM-dependent methyltransferase